MRTRVAALVAAYLVVAFFAPEVRAQSGHVLNGVGPINQSMGGAGTAAPLDASGALHWNPASITSLLPRIDIGVELFRPARELESRVDPGAFGPGVPASPLAGVTRSDTGAVPIPTIGFVHPCESCPWTVGFGAFGIGGFGVDYPAGMANPITSPQPPNGFGFGAIFSNYQLLQIAPTVAYQISERWSVGFAPTFNWATLEVSPFSAASPDDANGDGFPTYPRTSQAAAWGIGFQLGAYFEDESGWSVGVSIKSPQWFSRFEFDSEGELGGPRSFSFDLDYPMIVSVGAGYTGIDRVVVAFDIRFVDYRNTDGFQAAGFDATGAVTGFGWDSIIVVAIGVQYQVNEAISLRLGYSFNQNPIGSADTFFNVAAPALVQHHFNIGVSWQLSDSTTVSVAYHHGFENSSTGAWQSPAGAIPGTSVSSELSTDAVILGLSVKF